MDVVSEEQALQAVLGRGDFGGIDNEALDFSQLEDYINDEGNDNNIYFHEALVGGDLKLNDSPIGHSKSNEEESLPSSASPTISSTSPEIRRHPTPSLSNENNFGVPVATQQGPQRSSSVSCGSPTVSTSQTFKLAAPTSIASVQQVYHPSHHLPDSPPDSGSEPPFSPNNEEQKLSNGGLRTLKTGHNPHPHPRLLSTPSGTPADIMMQSQAESLKHFITYSGTQPLKHLSDSTSLCIPSSHPHQIAANLVSGGPHLTTPTNAGVVLTQLGSNIPSHLSSQLGSIPSSPQLGNLVQNPHQQPLVSHSHLGGIYGGSEEFLCDSLSNTSSINNPTKKRKLSDSPKNAVSSTVIGNGIAHIKRDPDGLSPEPTSSVILNPSEDEYSFDFNGPDNGMFMDSAYQCIRFQPFQPNTWHTLWDISMKELSPPNYRVDADKGFNFSNADEAFVCQKKNHFQVTVHIQAFGDPRYIKTQEGLKKVESFQLHFHGAKVESPSQTIKVEQSQSDRSKKPFYPVPMDLSQEQVIKTTVGRLHFSETTSNNMRKKGKPNPDQRYFYLVVGLFAHIGEQTYPIIAHASERIIVRASNPGQFENDMELSWQKGTTPESIYHAGRVGINTDRPDESLVVHGNIRLTGHIIQPSDARAKTNVQEMDSKEQLKNVANMKIVKYEYRPEFGRKAGLHNEELRGTGVIAQEVQFILPDAVREAGDVVLDGGEKIENFLVVNKERIFMENVGAVKELCKVTDNLETRIDELERINRKLTKMKRVDSLKSTSSCSTVTSGSSVNTAKKANHHTKKHQNRRRSLPEESLGGLSSFCGNRIVQATIIILVLVMTFCIVSVASLYILDWQRRHAISKSFQMDDKNLVSTHSPHYKDPTPFSNVVGPTKHAQGTAGSDKDTSKFVKGNFSASSSFISEASPKTSYESARVGEYISAINNVSYAESADNSVSDHENDTMNSADASLRIPVPVLKPQSLGTPSHCQVVVHPLPTTCVVKCCDAPVNPNVVVRSETIEDTRATDSYSYSKATVIVGQPQRRPENNTRIRAGLEGRSLNLSLVDPQSLSGEDRAENEAIPSHEISDAWLNKTRHQNNVYFNRSSNMYQPSSSSYLDQSSGIQDVQDNSANTVSNRDQETEQSGVTIAEMPASNEKDMTSDLANSSIKRKRRDLRASRYRRSDARNQFSKNAAKELSRSVESIRFPDWNSTLTSEYCLNLPCIQKTASVYNYLIPISKYMDQDYVTIQLNFATPIIVDHCISKEKTISCAAPNSHHYATEHRSSTNNNVEVRSQEWRIPVGFFLRSGYRFRIMSGNTENMAPCTLPDEERGRTFIEYNLVFQRKCDK